MFEWVGKTQWNVIILKGRLLQSPKHGKYYWCRIHICRKNLQIKIKYLGKYHDFYIQSDTSWSIDVFENFRNMCFEKYELDSDLFLTAPGLAWQGAFKVREVRSVNWYWCY